MPVFTWNGRSVPPELRKVPPGKYAFSRVDRPPRLTAKEEAGIEEALASLHRGEGIPARKVHAEMRAHLRKRAAQRKRRK